jgi:imidazolonepropionase-like amidohydrolase
MKTTRNRSVLTLLVLLLATPAFAGPPQAYKAARIWTGDGAPIANGVLVVRDGKVVAVGPRNRVTIPEDAEVHDLGLAVLIPGLVIAETTLGEQGRDDDRALTPEFRALDGFDFYADYTPALSGGVTTVQIAPGNKRLMPGQGGRGQTGRRRSERPHPARARELAHCARRRLQEPAADLRAADRAGVG